MNELGVSVVAARTLDIDLATRSVKLAAPLDLLESMRNVAPLPSRARVGDRPWCSQPCSPSRISTSSLGRSQDILGALR